MNHAQNVWLAHSMTFSVAFWLYCWYHSPDSKKARKMFQHLYGLMRRRIYLH